MDMTQTDQDNMYPEEDGVDGKGGDVSLQQSLLEASVSSPSAQSVPPNYIEASVGDVIEPATSPPRTARCPGTVLSPSKKSPDQGSSKKGIKKSPLTLPGGPSSRQQRSPVKPFFCCGSELSLVSLVEGLELKEGACSPPSDKSPGCLESSDEEDSSTNPNLSQTTDCSPQPGLARRKKGKKKDKHATTAKKKFWHLRFRGRWSPRGRIPQSRTVGHRCDGSHHSLGAGCSGSYHSTGSPGSGRRSPRVRPQAGQLIDLSQISDFDRLYPVEGIDELRLRERAQEMASGIDLSHALRPSLGISGSMLDILRRGSRLGSGNSESSGSPDSPTEDYSLLMNSLLQLGLQGEGRGCGGLSASAPQIHTQVDYIHCLVPHLVDILACPFYWGIMDRYQAERLLDNKPEGTFLLRDSAQEDFLFSVSFRRYNRSLHARVEQWNHRFSFDALDPAVYSAGSVCELMEHYKDASCCMFFEPMLTRPLARNFPFSLQHMCRASICDRLTYDQIRVLPLPNSLKQFLQVYHYKQKVRVRHFDGPELLRLL